MGVPALPCPKSLGHPGGCRRPWPVNMVSLWSKATFMGQSPHRLSDWWIRAVGPPFVVYYAVFCTGAFVSNPVV
jgi:hypothetical protein